MTWLPFDLHPEYPPEGIPRSDLFAKYGADFDVRLRASFARVGVAFNPPQDVVPNTLAALALNETARDQGLHRPLHDRLMRAYWEEARDIGSAAVLLELAAEVGLDAASAEAALTDASLVDRVRESTRKANAVGINGIPAFVLDDRLLVMGAQPTEVFESAVAQLRGRPE